MQRNRVELMISQEDSAERRLQLVHKKTFPPAVSTTGVQLSNRYDSRTSEEN